MKTKLSAISFSLLTILILSVADALAETVDFTDMDRGPSPTLQIDGVTISSANGGNSTPATVAGIGLGSATIGSFGTVDRIQDATSSMRESLFLRVSGSLNLVTIIPYFSVVGSNENIFLPFDVSYQIPGVTINTEYYRTVEDADPINFGFALYTPADTIILGLNSDWGNSAINNYLLQHPGATVQFGFTITSLDYTPAPVPETSTVMLLGIGLLSIAWLRRKSIA